MWIANLLALCALAPDSVAVPAVPPRTDSVHVRSDTARTDGAARRPIVPSAPAPWRSPDWSWEVAPRAGVLAVDFPQRSWFAQDLSYAASSDSLVVRQPFPGSDLGWSAGLDLVLRRRDAFRLVAGVGWTGWSAQAVAGRRDSLVRALAGDSLLHLSYSSDLWTGEVGFDLLVPRRILSVDGARDAFVGFRFRAGLGVLDGASTARGACTGWAVLVGADVASWRRWGLSGILGWNGARTTSSVPWSSMLRSSGGSESVSWDGGGLSLDFQLRWGPGRDTSTTPTAQKK